MYTCVPSLNLGKWKRCQAIRTSLDKYSLLKDQPPRISPPFHDFFHPPKDGASCIPITINIYPVRVKHYHSAFPNNLQIISPNSTDCRHRQSATASSSHASDHRVVARWSQLAPLPAAAEVATRIYVLPAAPHYASSVLSFSVVTETASAAPPLGLGSDGSWMPIHWQRFVSSWRYLWAVKRKSYSGGSFG